MGKGASFFSFVRRARGADVGAGAIVVEPRTEKHLRHLDIGEGVKVPEPVADVDAYSPYGTAWKEFDKLQKLAKGGKVRWLDVVWSVILPAIGLFDPHHIQKRDKFWLVGAGAAIAVAALLRAQYAKQRFLHWPCPRCHAEWPGTKTEKDPQCAVCGLKLHQMAP